MKRAICPAVTLLCAILASAAKGQEPCATCGFSERGDRMEGIEEREQVSGGSFELLSVHYLTAREAEPRGPDIHLYFWSPADGELDELKVWQPARYYRMEPAQKSFAEGLGRFSWERTAVIDPMQLSTETLYARVRTDDIYLPAFLTTGEPAESHDGYAFVFESGAGIDADCTILDRDDRSVVKRFECFEDYGGAITIRWDGTDEAGAPAADGIYLLEIEGDMLAEVIRPLETQVAFRHRTRLR